MVVESAEASRVKPRDGRSVVDRIGEYRIDNETVGAALIRLADEAGDRPAVVWADSASAVWVTWSQMCVRAAHAATTLMELNPGRARVAIAALNSVDWIVAMFACAYAGMPVVPISASGTDDEARYQLEHAQVGLVLADEVAGEHRVLDTLTALARTLARPVVVRNIANNIANNIADNIADNVADLGLKTVAPPAVVDADDEFLVQYTSGTTGRPKAASISHRAAVNCGKVFSAVWGGGPEDRFLNPLPLHHVGGSVTGVVTALAMGGTYALVQRFTAQALVDAFRHTRPTIAGMVPTMMIDLLGVPGVSPQDFASVRTIIGGATAVDPALVAEMEGRLGVRIIGSYGQSEAPAMLASSPDDALPMRMQTLGRTLAGRAVAIRTTAGDVLPTGDIGELCVRGALTMSGYLQGDGGLDTALDADGWRRTGDLCSMDDDGIVTFHGRIREVIIRGGQNVYPAEVEQALSSHESVGEIAVFGAGDERLGERVVAAVIPAADAAMDVAGLEQLAAERLSSYKHPVDWIEVATLPRTSTGKVRKHLLRESYEDGSLAANCGRT